MEFTSIDANTIRCTHRGEVSLEDCRKLKAFLRTVDRNLLLDWEGADVSDCARMLLTVRAMLPRTAVIGAELPDYVFRPLPGKDFYRYPVRACAGEAEALAWLNQESVVPVEFAVAM